MNHIDKIRQQLEIQPKKNQAALKALSKLETLVVQAKAIAKSDHSAGSLRFALREAGIDV